MLVAFGRFCGVFFLNFRQQESITERKLFKSYVDFDRYFSNSLIIPKLKLLGITKRNYSLHICRVLVYQRLIQSDSLVIFTVLFVLVFDLFV